MPDDNLALDPMIQFIQEHPLPADYFDITKLPKSVGVALPILQPGQQLQVEVLEALPGRPITGTRIIRPDGTISLGYYGDLLVAGLNRDQIKVKLLEQLYKLISEQTLGFCVASGPSFDQVKWLPAFETNRVFVDESINFAPPDSDLREQVKALSTKVDQLLKQTPASSAGGLASPPR